FETLARQLKQLVTTERVAGCSASLVLNSNLCVTRTTTGSSAEVAKSLDELQDRGQLYLSLGAGAKTLVSTRANIDARHEQAVVTVACEATLQRLIEVVESCGLELKCIEAETIALARAHGVLHRGEDEPALLIQFDNDGLEIAVAHRGNLLLDYRPGGGVSGEEIAAVLDQHHARLQRFCQRRLRDFSLQLRKVYLAGPADTVRAAERRLAQRGEYQAAAFDTQAASAYWERPSTALGPHQAALIGRALQEVHAADDSPSPNLMERWIAESRKHIRPILLRSGAPIAAVLLLAAGLAVVNLRMAGITQTLSQQVAELRPAQLEYKVIRRKVISSREKLKNLQRLSEGAPACEVTRVIASIGGCLPDDVWLSRVTITDFERLKLSGASYTESGVYDFVRYLNQAPGVAQVALEGTGTAHTGQGPSTTFDLNLKLASDAADGATAKPQGVASR
ncbi:MAG: PilN domain-containing protein, partial [Planctomycetota bacterium]